MGMRIGKNCVINSSRFDTEPFLIEIGDNVAIAQGTIFMTHDGSAWILRKDNPGIDIFGEVKIGDNTFIGMNALILPGAHIGSNCVIGAGSVVRGIIPDNSVAFGNPAKIVFATSMLKRLLLKHKHALKTKGLGPRDKKEALLKHFNCKD
jgi:acetyltransferase-like isoleucine patch superfamily enzyme